MYNVNPYLKSAKNLKKIIYTLISPPPPWTGRCHTGEEDQSVPLPHIKFYETGTVSQN